MLPLQIHADSNLYLLMGWWWTRIAAKALALELYLAILQPLSGLPFSVVSYLIRSVFLELTVLIVSTKFSLVWRSLSSFPRSFTTSLSSLLRRRVLLLSSFLRRIITCCRWLEIEFPSKISSSCEMISVIVVGSGLKVLYKPAFRLKAPVTSG